MRFLIFQAARSVARPVGIACERKLQCLSGRAPGNSLLYACCIDLWTESCPCSVFMTKTNAADDDWNLRWMAHSADRAYPLYRDFHTGGESQARN